MDHFEAFEILAEEPIHFIYTDADKVPCACCAPHFALSDDGKVWECEREGRSWLMLDAAPDVRNHPIEACNGKCGNPLHTYNVFLAKAVFYGLGWGDIALEEEEAMLDALSPAERAVREAEEARRAAAAAVAKPLIALHNAQMDNIQRKKISAGCKTFGNHMKGEKKHAPCRNLYTFDHDHNRCMTKHVSSECWAHVFEDGAAALYVDPEQGAVLPLSEVDEIAAVQRSIKRGLTAGECQMVRKRNGTYTVYWTPRTCWMMHPDEPTWFAGWMADSRAVDPKAPRQQPQPQQQRQGQQQYGGSQPHRGGPQRQQQGQWQDFRGSQQRQDFRGMAAGGGGDGWETAGGRKRGF